jgi:hypothetical protein
VIGAYGGDGVDDCVGFRCRGGGEVIVEDEAVIAAELVSGDDRHIGAVHQIQEPTGDAGAAASGFVGGDHDEAIRFGDEPGGEGQCDGVVWVVADIDVQDDDSVIWGGRRDRRWPVAVGVSAVGAGGTVDDI